MRKDLRWTKGAFSRTIKINNYKELIGTLEMQTFGSGASGQIGGHRYKFKSKGFFSRTIDVFHLESKSLIASIKFGGWGRKAMIHTKEKKYKWTYRNFWQTKWVIVDEQKTYLSATNNSFMTSGNITVHEIEDFLILSAIFIKSYFQRQSAGVAAA